MEYVNYNTVIDKIYECRRESLDHKLPPQHYLMGVIAAISKAVGAVDCEQDEFEKAMENYKSFPEAYNSHILGTRADVFAEGAILIFEFMGVREMKLCDPDNCILNIGPGCFSAIMESVGGFQSYLFDLVATLTYRNPEQAQTLDIIKMWEQKPEDAELEKILNEEMGEIQDEYDLELRTSFGYENYMLSSKLTTVLSVLSSWFKQNTVKGFEWHIKARMYYNKESGVWS